MSDEFGGNRIKDSGLSGEGGDSTGDNHPGCGYTAAVMQRELQLCTGNVDRRDFTGIYIGNSGTLVPQPVVNKALQIYRRGEMIAAYQFVGVKGERVVGIGDMRGGPSGAKEHTGGHGSPPEMH